MSRVTPMAARRTNQRFGVIMVLVAGVLFAANGTVSKLMLLGGFDAPQLTALRAAGALVGLTLLVALSRPGLRRLAITRDELPRVLGFGLTGSFLVPMLYFVTIRRLPVGIGLLFEYMGPVLVALWIRFGRRLPVRRQLWLGLALCVGGLAAVAQVWTGELHLDPLGIAAGLTCAVLLAVYYLVGASSVAERDPLSLTWWAFAVAAVAGAIVRPWWRFPTPLLQDHSHGAPMWLLASYLIIFGTVVAYLFTSISMQHLPPTSVGVIGMIEPVTASAIAWLVLGETLVAAQIVGGVIVLIGVVLAETARTTPTPLPPT